MAGFDSQIDEGKIASRIDSENFAAQLKFDTSNPLKESDDLSRSDAPVVPGSTDAFSDVMSSPLMQIPAGIYDTIVETGRTVHDIADFASKHSDTAKYIDEVMDEMPDAPEWPAASGTGGEIARTLANWVSAAYLPASKLKHAHWAVRGFGSMSVAAGTGIDPEKHNSADLIQDLAADNEALETAFAALPDSLQKMLMALPHTADETHPLVQRVQNALVEGSIAIPIERLIMYVRAFKASRDAKKLMKLDRNLASEKAAVMGDGGLSPSLAKDPDIIQYNNLQKALQEAKAGGNAQHIEQVEKRIERFVAKNPEGAKRGFAAAEGKPLEGSAPGEGSLKEWGVPSLRPDTFAAAELKGIFSGSEQFVTKVSLGNIEIAKLIVNPAKTNYSQHLHKAIAEIRRSLQREMKGNLPGRPSLRRNADEEFERALATLGVEGTGATEAIMTKSLARSLEKGAQNVQDAIILDLIRSAHGVQTYRLMRAALAGDVSAARMLPKQLAIGAEIESIARKVKSPMNKEMLKQIDESHKISKSGEVSGVGFGKNFNEEATNMMMRHAEMVPGFDGVDLALRLNMLRTPEQYTKFMQQISRPGMFAAVQEAFYNSILSGSVVVNFIGSHAYALYQIPVRFLAGAIGASRVFPRTAADIKMGEGLAMIYGYASGLREQFPILMKNLLSVAQMKKPVSVSGLQKFEQFDRAAMTAEGFKPAILAAEKIMDNATRGLVSIKGPLDFAANATGNIFRTIQNLFATSDGFNRGIGFSMSAHTQAYRAVANSGKSIGNMGREMKDHISHIPKTEGEAAEFANMIAFVDDVERSGNRWWDVGTKGFKDAVDEYPITRFSFPFVRSQASLYSASVSNSPFAFFSPRFIKAMEAGGGERQLALSKAMLGTGIYYNLAESWSNFTLTGSGPKDPGERAALSALGWKPNSIKVGGDSLLATLFDYERSMEASLDRVIDGDTIDVRDADGNVHRVRLNNLSAAELGTFEGASSKEALANILSNNEGLTVTWSKKAAKKKGWKSERLLGKVYMNGVDKHLGELMVEADAADFVPTKPVYLSYAWLQPFAMGIGTMVDSFEAVRRSENDNERDSIFQMGWEAIASNLAHQQYLAGMRDLLSLTYGGERGFDIGDASGKFFSHFVPSIVRGANKSYIDPTRRDYKTIDPTLTPEHRFFVKMLNKSFADSPYLSDKLIPDYDGLGRVGVKPPAFGLWNFVKKSEEYDNPVYKSFIQNRYFPKKLKQDLDGEGVTLTLPQYAEFQKLLGTLKEDGRTLIEAMRYEVDNFTSEDTIGAEGGRHALLSSVRTQYRWMAIDEMYKRYPELEAQKEALDEEQARKAESNDMSPVGPKSLEPMIMNFEQGPPQ